MSMPAPTYNVHNVHNSQQLPELSTPPYPALITSGSGLVANKQNNIVKKLQIVENPSFEPHKINDLSQETSGEETVEAETSETESKFSSEDECDDTSSSSTPPEDYVEHVEVSISH